MELPPPTAPHCAARGAGTCAVRGMGLMELLVVLALVAVLAVLAVPSMGGLLFKRQVQAAAEALVSDLRLARSEAIRRVAVVTVCSSLDGVHCSIAAAWREGWLVFADTNANQSLDAGEALIRVQTALPGVASVASAAPRNDKAAFSFHPTGWAKAASQTLLFTPARSLVEPRVVCISNQGRPSLRPAPHRQCS